MGSSAFTLYKPLQNRMGLQSCQYAIRTSLAQRPTDVPSTLQPDGSTKLPGQAKEGNTRVLAALPRTTGREATRPGSRSPVSLRSIFSELTLT